MGAAIGYNEIHDDASAAIEDATVRVNNGPLQVSAASHAVIGGGDVGVAAGTGDGGKLTLAGSLTANVIVDTL